MCEQPDQKGPCAAERQDGQAVQQGLPAQDALSGQDVQDTARRRGVRGLAVFVLRVPLWVYRRGISPLLGPRCRYYPSCSAYMDEALQRHGALAGLLLGTARLCRCHPLARGDVFDPVPERFDWRALFRYKQATAEKQAPENDPAH